jgi:hypothetical protein
MKVLRSPSGWSGYAITVVTALFAQLAWAALCLGFLLITDSAPPGTVDTALPDGWKGLALIWLDAPIEELSFRMPLAIPAMLRRETLLAPMIAALSIAFGLAHGTDLWHVCAQGGAGLILSFVFLRCGGLHGHPLRGWSLSSATHALYNSVLWVVLRLAGS